MDGQDKEAGDGEDGFHKGSGREGVKILPQTASFVLHSTGNDELI